MGRVYAIPFSSVAVSAAQDLWELTNTSTRLLRILACELSQSSEVGDTAEEILPILFRRGSSATSSGSGGTTPTPAPLETGIGAASFTAEANNTTRMSGGTITTIVSTNWNERISPYQWTFDDRTAIIVGPSERFTVELASAPADSLTMSGTLWVEEIG